MSIELDGVSGQNLLDRTPGVLDASDPLEDVQRLAQGMTVPGGACAGLEVHAVDPGAGSHPADAGDQARKAARMTHDYKRNGTTSLYAALEIATGEVTGACYPQHRHQYLLGHADAWDRTPPLSASAYG